MNFFRSYFYGKPGKRDFTERDLPDTRWKLFWQVLQVRRGSMLGLNFLYLLCWIPAILWSLYNAVGLNGMLAENAHPDVLGLLSSYLLILFPLTAITGPFTMGASYVMRNWARDEHSDTAGDFGRALKANWRQGLLYGLLAGALPLVCWICLNFYFGLAKSAPLFYLPAALTLIAALVLGLSFQLMPTLIVTYRLRFSAIVRNAVLMTLASLPRAVAAKLATLALPLALLLCARLVPGALYWLGPAVSFLYLIFLLSFNKLITASYSNAMCEKYLNPKIEGASVNIGLRPEEGDK